MTFVIFKHVVSDNGNLSVVGNCIDDFVSVWEISNGIKSDKAFTVIEIETIFIEECNFVEFNHFSYSFLFEIAVRQWARSISRNVSNANTVAMEYVNGQINLSEK